MILNSLSITNFGVFKGEHNVDLIPREKYGRKRPIILFGGLNGAGKTTTLTAIRLALYGRQSFGRGIPLNQYHQHLSDLIHIDRATGQKIDFSEVQLSFTYGRHGKINEYVIVRSWERKSKSIVEHLEITQNGESLDYFNVEQKQSFLNELAPIGVSDLFFFDGEKIAELAEDDTNEALIDAINRLLGLDIVDRLRADLGIYLREQKQSEFPKDISKEIRAYEKSYNENYKNYQNKLTELEDLKTVYTSTAREVDSVKLRLSDLGGDWAKSKEAAEQKYEALLKERKETCAEMQALLSDLLPLAFAPKKIGELLKSLEDEREEKVKTSVRSRLEGGIKQLNRELAKELGSSLKAKIDSAINNAFLKVLSTKGSKEIIHDVSDSALIKIKEAVEVRLPHQRDRFNKHNVRLDEIEEKLSSLANVIARAPEQSRLEKVLSELGDLQAKLGGIASQVDYVKNETKQFLKAAIDSLRRLNDLDKKYSQTKSMEKGIELAINTRGMLEEFSEITKLRKISVLEEEFIKSFCKLARKDDMSVLARIDPVSFNLSLIDKDGNEINKKKLSAGEKQIYAIAMLEALGRTSGRNLPIIIDTPLGRLDSKHRDNLVKNYFPTASHQVLILSTDTEIDEQFYKQLSPEVSHAFSVDYMPQEGSSYFNEGYFWR